ncbi:hypothetical protein [Flammeovirga sp. SJP92]|uniref:hypothetical protein n=1 Tax=Flammeovirga sp. SJP92 TaxID=1775430 RepID=UPI000788E220|nr:hypothetical protein [Flammeovirga sp. SJP92]KXX69294.1 hypothetical protein AVL50_19970 [Flammeovirga sp. SJP92]
MKKFILLNIFLVLLGQFVFAQDDKTEKKINNYISYMNKTLGGTLTGDQIVLLKAQRIDFLKELQKVDKYAVKEKRKLEKEFKENRNRILTENQITVLAISRLTRKELSVLRQMFSISKEQQGELKGELKRMNKMLISARKVYEIDSQQYLEIDSLVVTSKEYAFNEIFDVEQKKKFEEFKGRYNTIIVKYSERIGVELRN